MAEQPRKAVARQSLTDYLVTGGSTLFGKTIGYTGYGRRLILLAIDNPEQGVNYSHNIVDISFYVANLLGLRRDKNGNILVRASLAEIAITLSTELGHKITHSDIDL